MIDHLKITEPRNWEEATIQLNKLFAKVEAGINGLSAAPAPMTSTNGTIPGTQPILNAPLAAAPPPFPTIPTGEGTGGGGTSGVVGASYVTVATEASLNFERVLTAGSGITLTDNGPNSTIVVDAVGSAVVLFSVVTTSTTPYTVASGANVYVRGSASAGADQVVDLPAATGSGHIILVKKMDANPHNVVVTRAGADLIDGLATYTITVQYSAIWIIDAAANVWDIVVTKP